MSWLGWWLGLGGALLGSLLTAQEYAIPASPRQLTFPDAAVELPVVDGRLFELRAGPKVFVAEDHALPLVELALALRIGTFLDPPDRSGLSYLTATQMRRGGAGELDAARFDNRLDDLGARLNTVSGTTRSGASLSVPSWSLDAALDLLFAMLTEPRFQADRLASARSNLLESMANRNVDPLEILEREWQWLMFGEEHFTSRPMTPASLASITADDLRRFHRRYWRPGSMIVALSGDFDTSEVIAQLDRRFADWPTPSTALHPVPWPPPRPATSAPPGLYHYELDIPQAKVLLGQRMSRRLAWTDRDRFALEVLAEILGGQGAISRLGGRLRTAEGLVYRASASLSAGDLWPGVLQIFFETDGRTTPRAVAAALEEIDRLRREPVHPTELEVVKETMLARLRLAVDTGEEIAGLFAEDLLLDRPHSFRQQFLDQVQGLGADEIQLAARRLLQPEAFLCLVVGRWSEIGGEAPLGNSELERRLGHRRQALPERDPSTLEPRDVDESEPQDRPDPELTR